MSEENRRKVYEKLKAEGKLDQDDGALEKEFGTPEKKEVSDPKPKASVKKRRKK